MVFLGDRLAPPAFPARSEFVYGEWLRKGFEAGAVPEPVSDPENTLILAQARREARPLLGPALADFLAEIPMQQILRAMREGLPALLANLQGDERNVLLTLARMWRTAATGEFVTKDAAADWAVPHLPGQPAQTLLHARSAYLGEIKDDWANRQEEVRKAAAYLHRQIISLL
jgi:streptomycin 3"-adenylyltransferase